MESRVYCYTLFGIWLKKQGATMKEKSYLAKDILCTIFIKFYAMF